MPGRSAFPAPTTGRVPSRCTPALSPPPIARTTTTPPTTTSPTAALPLVTRSEIRLRPDPLRVLAKPYLPGEDPSAPETRVARLLLQVDEMDEPQVEALLAEARARFAHRHRDLEAVLERSFAVVEHQLADAAERSTARRLLMGAYFTHEYAIEAAALFNPSIVEAPDQSGLARGERRVVLSVRAVGEGHLSSIEFRTGVLGADAGLVLDPPGRFAETGRRRSPVYQKRLFTAKLDELGVGNEVAALVTDDLPDHFTRADLDQGLERLAEGGTPPAIAYETVNVISWLAASNYRVRFPADTPLSERVLFPESPGESRGMEDARFVRFTDDDGSVRYHATYTAFDGFNILPQLITTTDFTDFAVATLNGEAAANKGMALFPRRIGGRFVALSRFDRQNIDVMTSDDVRFWHSRARLRAPVHPWELLQMGNCGSPIETSEGWLVLTHGVGPLRRYCIGALLLDLDDPRRVIADLPSPLLEPVGEEREGYVPNVVYSCGGLLHAGRVVLPYGYSDSGVGVAMVSLDDLLARLAEHPVADPTRPTRS